MKLFRASICSRNNFYPIVSFACFLEHGHALVLPIRASHKFIRVVSHFCLVFSSFQFLFSVFIIFAMWKVEVSCMSCLSNHTCNRTWHLHKQVYTCFYFFMSFILSYIEALATHKVNVRCWTNLMAPHSRDIMPLDFFFCRVLWRIMFAEILWMSLQLFQQGYPKKSKVWQKECWPVHGQTGLWAWCNQGY